MQGNQNYQTEVNGDAIIKAANAMESTILITGSTGTGKSHLAQVIHDRSKRRLNKFVKVNLATISDNIIESELFGHEKGAFTGADTKRIGRLEANNGGTVFLDEIGELSPRLQTKLLDFIQYKKITPVGSNREIELDVRVIVATNKNLDLCVKNGEFRADLYHRINIFHVRLLDLKERKTSILPLAIFFAKKYAAQAKKNFEGFTSEAERALLNHDWPGNIRELENAMEFAVAMEIGRKIDLHALPFATESQVKEKTEVSGLKQQTTSGHATDFEFTIDYHECKDKFERMYLEYALRSCRGQINLTSRTTGMNKVSMIEKIKKFGIDWRAFRDEMSTFEVNGKFAVN